MEDTLLWLSYWGVGKIKTKANSDSVRGEVELELGNFMLIPFFVGYSEEKRGLLCFLLNIQIVRTDKNYIIPLPSTISTLH